MKLEWKLSLENWEGTNVESLKYILQEAQKNLSHTLKENDKLTARGFTLLSIIIPIVSLSLAFLLKDILDAEGQVHHIMRYFVLGTLIILTFCLFFLIRVIFPRNIMYDGREPIDIAPEFLESNELSQEQLYPALLIGEIEVFQQKIDWNNKQNFRRIKQLKTTIWVISCTLAMVILSLIVLGFVTI